MLHLLIMAAGQSLALPPTGRTILLDSVCESAEYGQAAALDLGDGVRLHGMHDRNFIYLCISLPPNSLGALDLYMRQDERSPVTNLHVSAQVGERTYKPGENPPWQWRNHRQWFGTVVPFSGVTVEGGQASGDFDFSAGRELQLAKSRFSDKRWEMRLQLYDVAGAKDGMIAYPSNASDDWFEVVLEQD